MGFDYRPSTGLGETEIFERHKQNLVCTRTQGRGSVIPQEMEQDLPVSAEVLLQWPAMGTRALAAAALGGACWHKSFRGSSVALIWSL